MRALRWISFFTVVGLGCGGDGSAGGADAGSCPAAAETPAPRFLWADEELRPDTRIALGGTMWVGKAAWSDRDQVKSDLQVRVERDEVPYVFFYHWGDGPGRTMNDFQNATDEEIADWEDFGRAIAEGIGDGPAYVVIEPEWDSNPSAAGSDKFKEPLRRIMATFRDLAPNALLINGPGLWKPDGEYAAFADVAVEFDLQGFLVHVVSNDPDCTWRTDGTSYEGGDTLEEALGIVDRVRTDAARVRSLFGGGEVVLTDLAVTRCGWGAEGQQQILANLVDALPSLYDDDGLRGSPLRDGGPSEDERYLGVNNEGDFGYTGQPAEAEVIRGGDLMQEHLRGLEEPPPGDAGAGGSDAGACP